MPEHVKGKQHHEPIAEGQFFHLRHTGSHGPGDELHEKFEGVCRERQAKLERCGPFPEPSLDHPAARADSIWMAHV